jgi:hypothetical protein
MKLSDLDFIKLYNSDEKVINEFLKKKANNRYFA